MEVKQRNKFLREGLEGNVIAFLEEQKVYFLLKKIKMAARWARKARPVLPQPLVQNSFFPTKFPCHPNGGKKQENSGKCIIDPTRNRTSLVITLPENLGKFSRVPSMKVSAPHIRFCFVFLIFF